MSFIVPGVISAIVIVVLSSRYKNKDKKDKGFKLNYFALSYRRKLIRTVISAPVVISSAFFLFYSPEFTTMAKMLFIPILLIVFVLQLIYNFYMWKKKEAWRFLFKQ
ncbi:ATPase [Pontibacillus salicampi]|uniref:ATPase n=1 Tax=Pontibacillus salicampi TaxID=1449801 RepID=A0ABV6LMV2_9BACI